MSESQNPLSVVPTNIEDELKTSYLAYSMSVIVGRAIPDVRDGLKPVHRRILYTMHEMGNTHSSSYKKSARITGDCFVAGTLVHTERGLAPIESLQVGDRLRKPDGSLTKIVECYHNPPAAVVRVKLSNGSSMTVTPGQLFRVLRDDLTIEWERADRLAGKRVLVTNPRSCALPPHPEEAARNEAYCLGLMIAEGYLADRNASLRIGVTMVDKEPLNVLSSYCRAYSLEPRWTGVKPQKAHYQPQHTVRVNHWSAAYEACSNTCAEKLVPERILADRRLYAPFIAGFIDGDGYIRSEGSQREVVLTSTSELLLEQLQTMLADGGIHSYFTCEREAQDNLRDCYTVRVTGENASRLCLLISEYLQIPRKKEAASGAGKWSQRALNTETDCIPAKVIFEELSSYHIGSGWYKDKNGKKFRAGIKYPNGTKIRYSSDLHEKTLSYRQLEEWGIDKKLERLGSVLAGRLQKLRDKYCFLTVDEVEPTGLAETFDVQVDDSSHEFVAQGCAVHNCMGKYHPHGDTAIYDALVRMAQDFNMRYMLVDGQGNFGSVDGDAPAAMRYTEVRLHRFAQELLADIDKDTVEFGPNYDDSLQEPLVLPSKVPNLLLNGTEGIAVGMATKIPPHNLTEVLSGTIALIDNPDISIEELMGHIQGPDFPTAGIINGLEGIQSAYKYGRGIIKMRGKVDIEVHPKTERETLIINEIPYQVNKAKLIEKIAELVKEKKIEGITDIRDESNREGMRVVIELKRDATGAVILNQLYKLTPLQSSFGVILLAIVDGRPEVLTLKQILQRFIEHRREVVTRRSLFELKKAEERFHILLGLLMAVDHIDRVITIIRGSPEPDTARKRLCAEEFKGELGKIQLFAGLAFPQVEEALKTGIFKMSDAQAKAILELRLHRLTGLERDKILGEANDVKDNIERLKAILGDVKILMKVIVKELEEIREKYGDERRTQIVPDEGEISTEDLISREDVVITVSHAGYIKRSSVSLYRSQRRGGRGKNSMATKEEDFVADLFVASTHHHFLIFTDRGRVFSKKVYEIPSASANAKGKAIVNLISLEKEEKVTAFIPVAEFKEGTYIVFVTKKGIVKKTDLSLFANIRQSGIIALLIDDGDQLITVRMTGGKQDLFIGTKDGLSIRFAEEELRPLGRAARGVKGISLKEQDEVVGMEVLSGNEQETILTVCENGYGKRTEVSEYRDQHRGGSGVITIKATERNGDVVGFARVGDDDQIMVVTNKGSLIRMATKEIRVIGRNTQGVRIIFNDEEGEKVVALARLPREEGSTEEGANGAAQNGTPKTEGPLDPTKN